MASGGHLNSWMAYVHKFMFYYTKRPGAGVRPPTPAEAEEADRECLSEIFRMAYHDDLSLDDAIQSVVREDLLRMKLTVDGAAQAIESSKRRRASCSCLMSLLESSPLENAPKVGVNQPTAANAIRRACATAFRKGNVANLKRSAGFGIAATSVARRIMVLPIAKRDCLGLQH